MADQGSGGAFEISQRMTAMLGWGATSGFKEDWTWDQAAETYALDPDMAAKLRKSNPQARLCTGAPHPHSSSLYSSNNQGLIVVRGSCKAIAPI